MAALRVATNVRKHMETRIRTAHARGFGALIFDMDQLLKYEEAGSPPFTHATVFALLVAWFRQQGMRLEIPEGGGAQLAVVWYPARIVPADAYARDVALDV